jgi:hypothetical protein
MATAIDKNLLTINGPCIIYVNEVNSPKGYWWGTVVLLEPFTVRITGGRFGFQKDSLGYYNLEKPLYTNEQKDITPSYQCTIYPDIPSVRRLLHNLLKTEEELNHKNKHIIKLGDFFKDLIVHLKLKGFEEAKENKNK